MNTYQKRLPAWLIFTLFLFAFPCNALAQDSTRDSLKLMIESLNLFIERQAVEKVYLQTDKPSYSAGDTLWFKAYLFKASYLEPSEKSGVLYVEIANDSNMVIKRIMSPVSGGRSAGQVTLGELEMPPGAYILRAYTNWMRDFGETYVFQKPFYIGDEKVNDWLVSYNTRILSNNGNNTLQLGLKLQQVDRTPVGLRELQIRLADGKHTWLRTNEDTNVDGLLNLNVDLPEKAETTSLNLFIQDRRKSAPKRTLVIPLSVNRPERLDLQFMPEGGDLVAGLPVRVAFKAVNEDGRGADVSGEIYNSKSLKITAFKSLHKGMGSFNFIPKAGESYFARVNLPNGKYRDYPLPLVKINGISLRVDNAFKSDSCEVTVRASPEMAGSNRIYYLIGQARGIACYGSAFNIQKGVARFKIANSLFPTGIARFTLTGQNKIALSERIVFIERADNLNLSTTQTKAFYSTRDSVSLQLKVSDTDGNPVQGSFSIAVTDDNQVKTDSLSDFSILNQMLLTSDLKGEIENPGYYMQDTRTARVWQDLDHLLLTQGWTGFEFAEVFKPVKNPKYQAETQFLIKGKVTNAFNKPISSSGVSLLSQKPYFVRETRTDERGDFYFEQIFPIDTAEFFIQAKNKNGKNFNVGIEMEEFVPPVFTASVQRLKPWYVNIDTSSLRTVDKKMSLKHAREKLTGTVLKEVVIKSKRIIKDSKNLNGPGEADFTITREELEKAGRTTLGDLLSKNIKSFRLQMTKGGRLYVIGDRKMHLIIDGINTEFYWNGEMPLHEYFKHFLEYYSAEEIKGIEVMTSKSYSYAARYLPPMEDPSFHSYIEVTTRSGSGPLLKKMVGTYVYRPMPFSLPKKFYSPKYIAGSTADGTDIRSTIFWEPDLITNKQGLANIKFFTADTPGNYSIIIEGTDLNGKLGYTRGKIIVK
ncbi:MAG TPA: hypothetical protein VGB63_04645 [Pedobacter sp.]|jgi:hypothetical protein